jgi:hypothetical protein
MPPDHGRRLAGLLPLGRLESRSKRGMPVCGPGLIWIACSRDPDAAHSAIPPSRVMRSSSYCGRNSSGIVMLAGYAAAFRLLRAAYRGRTPPR